ncbi:MAG: GGDEF domain-containing protein [Christensenellaceae bacterium]
MFRNKNKILLVLFTVAVFITAALLIYVGNTFILDDTRFGREPVMSYSDGWSYQNEELGDLPAVVHTADKAVRISKTLPAKMTHDSVINIETNHQTLRAFIEDKLIYEHGFHTQTSFGKMFGTVQHMINVPRQEQGKTISLELGTTYADQAVVINPIKISSEGSMILSLIRKDLGSITFFFLIFVLGLVLLIAAWVLIGGHKDVNIKSFVYLGIFAIISAIWVITDTNALQFFMGNKAIGYILSFCTFMIMPIPFLLYIKQICVQHKKIFDILSFLFVGIFFLNILLYILNLADLTQTIFLTHALLMVSIISVLTVCFVEKKQSQNKNVEGIIWGLCILCATALLSIVQFYIDKDNRSSFLFRYGLLIFLIILSVHTLKRSVQLISASAEANTYRKLAYTDIMTRMNNRAAFDIEMLKLEESIHKCESIAFVVFDIDNLKEINDTYGHLIGDETIIGVGTNMKKVFDHTCYRVGGDEFVAVLKNNSKDMIEEKLTKFKKVIEEYNEVHKHHLNVSWGYTIRYDCEILDGKALKHLLDGADYKMYENKIKK